MIKKLLPHIADMDKWVLAMIWPSLVWMPQVTSVFIILFVLLLLLKNKLSFFFKSGISALMLMLYYGVSWMSLLWSTDVASGLFDLEVKLSLLVFPLIIGFSKYTRADIEKQIFIGIQMLTIVLSVLIIRFLFYALLMHQILSYTEFSLELHPTYLSMYCIFALSYIWFHSKDKHFIYSSILFISIILSASKAGLIALIGILIYYLLQKYRLYALIGLLFMSIGLYYILFKTNYLQFISDRVKTTKEVLEKAWTHQPLPIETNSIRLFAWTSAIESIQKNLWIGVGVGDTRHELNRVYSAKNLSLLSAKNINAHNVFLQIALATGMLGLLPFLAAILLILLESLQKKMVFISVFMIVQSLILFNTESILDTQAGTIFTGLTYALFSKYLVL